MPKLVWDKVGSKTYESGLDRGVLYLPNGTAVPWNGLTSVEENLNRSVSSIFYEGLKVGESIDLGSFSATLSAFTYPEELDELEGARNIRRGFSLDEQPMSTFGLSYRTRIGDDINGDVGGGYKIHIIYNVTAIPSNTSYSTIVENSEAIEFQWDLTTTPVELPGFRGSASITIKTNDLDPLLLEEIESILYGSGSADASLLPMDELVAYINDWFRLKITDNGDGTWTAYTKYEGYIFFLPDEGFRLENANATYIDDHTFTLSDTKDLTDIPRIKITNNGDGTWTASTSDTGLIEIVGDTFTIYNANMEMIDAITYTLSDTIS